MEDVASYLSTPEREVRKLISDLLRIEAVRDLQGVYSLSFPVYTVDDRRRMLKEALPVASKISRGIISQFDEVREIAEGLSAAGQVEMDVILFSVVGCFFLDWYCLETLHKEGLLIRSKPQPGGREYVLQGKTRMDERTANEMGYKHYIASSSSVYDGYTFTSFGEGGLKYTLPNIFWFIRHSFEHGKGQYRWPTWVNEKIQGLMASYEEKTLGTTAEILFSLTKGPRSYTDLVSSDDWTAKILDTLIDMGYVVHHDDLVHLVFPVFEAHDKEVINDISTVLMPAVFKQVSDSYDSLASSLSAITPFKNNISMQEVYGEVWHCIFGQSNRLLAEKGYIHDPPSRREGESRYVSWISKFSL